jgi:hypothetical protein
MSFASRIIESWRKNKALATGQGLEGRGLEDAVGLVLSAASGFAHLCDPGG